MRILITLLLLLVNVTIVYSQGVITDDFIKHIKIGYTTRWDIEQILGHGEYVTKKLLNYYNGAYGVESNDIYRETHYNGLLYPNLNLTFICAEDGELISGIRAEEPYKGKFGIINSIELGKTSLIMAFPSYDSVRIGTTMASHYLYFDVGEYLFYLKKNIEFPEFESNPDYYKNQPILVINLNLNDYESYPSFKYDRESKNYYSKPYYSPESERHINSYYKAWPHSIPWVLLPLYMMTGGQREDITYNGYWKEYFPNHKIAYEGEYMDGEKVGEFKYYDKNGKLERTEKYSYPIPWVKLSIIILGILGIILFWKRRKKKV